MPKSMKYFEPSVSAFSVGFLRSFSLVFVILKLKLCIATECIVDATMHTLPAPSPSPAPATIVSHEMTTTSIRAGSQSIHWIFESESLGTRAWLIRIDGVPIDRWHNEQGAGIHYWWTCMHQESPCCPRKPGHLANCSRNVFKVGNGAFQAGPGQYRQGC